MRTKFPWSKALILLCLALGLAACSAEKQPDLPWIPTDGVVLAFGDSLTHGSGAKTAQAYPALLQQLIDREVAVVATPGDKSAAGLEKLPQALEQYQPELLILCLGGNDFLRKQPRDTTISNLQAMIDMAQAQNISVLLLGVPQPALFGLKADPLYRELAQKNGLPLENDILAEVLSDRDTKSDQIHPNAAGYRKVAQAIADLLRKTGAI